MTRIEVVERILPLDLPEPRANPTGEVYNLKKPFTLPLNQTVTKSNITGNYTEIDRKLWATLVSLAWDQLKTQVIHEADARAINALFREASGRTGNDTAGRILASARNLSRLSIDLEDDEEHGVTTLLAGLSIKKVSGKIHYQFSDLLLRHLLNNQRFSRLRLHFMIGLSGKYSVSLYMILEAAANLHHPVLDYSIDELRTYLSVPTGKLLRWVDFYRFAIEPTLKQINVNPKASGFHVACEVVKRHRKFERIKFTVTKSESRQLVDEEIKNQKSKNQLKISSETETKGQKHYSIDAALGIIRKQAPGLDAHWVLKEFEEKSVGVEVKNPLGMLTNFARKLYKEEKHRL